MSAHRSAVLILAYAYPPEIASGAARPHRFAKYLTEFGYSAHVITAGIHPEAEPQPNVIRLPDDILLLDKVLRRLLIPGELGFSWIPRALASAETLIKTQGITQVISTSPPATTHVVALQLKRRYGLKWIADFRDPLADNPFAPDRWVTRRVNELLESLIFKHADAVVTVTDSMAKEWGQKFPQSTGKISVIWNGYDPQDMFLPGPPPVRETRLMVHAGSLYGGRRPTILLAAMERLLASGRLSPGYLRVRLIGALDKRVMSGHEDLWERLNALGMLEWSGDQVPQREAQRELSEANSLLVIDLNVKRVGNVLPAKIFEYVLSGRPIMALTEAGSPVDRILPASGIPSVCIYSDDSDAVVDEKLTRFLQIPAGQTRPTPWFFEQFDGRKQTAALASLLTPAFDLCPK